MSNARLNVLFLTAWYPTVEIPYRGIFVREHAKAVTLYDNVTVLHAFGAVDQLSAPYLLTKESDPSLTEGIPTYLLRHRRVGLKLEPALRHWSLFRVLQQVIAEVRPDVIHANIHRVALQAVLAGKLHRIPVVITEHNSAFPRKLLSKLDLYEAKLAFKAASAVMPVSQALQRGIEASGVQANFQIVPNVVNTDLFAPTLTAPTATTTATTTEGGPIKLLCVGNMPETHIKGYPHLFKALATLVNEQPWQLEIIGDGPMLAEYKILVATLGLTERITFRGYQPKAAIVRAMDNADLFVLSSVWDNMPCVLIEAMAMGLPIVATRTGGIPEMIGPAVGLLAEPGNAESLRQTLGQMFAQLRNFPPTQIVASARSKYSMPVVGRQFDTIYRTYLHQP